MILNVLCAAKADMKTQRALQHARSALAERSIQSHLGLLKLVLFPARFVLQDDSKIGKTLRVAGRARLVSTIII